MLHKNLQARLAVQCMLGKYYSESVCLLLKEDTPVACHCFSNLLDQTQKYCSFSLSYWSEFVELK